MSTKLDKVISDIEKTEKKITEMQTMLREMYDKKTELENVEIVNTIRAMVMETLWALPFLCRKTRLTLLCGILPEAIDSRNMEDISTIRIAWL